MQLKKKEYLFYVEKQQVSYGVVIFLKKKLCQVLRE